MVVTEITQWLFCGYSASARARMLDFITEGIGPEMCSGMVGITSASRQNWTISGPVILMD